MVLSQNDGGIFLRLLAPFTPYLAEELWQKVRPSSPAKGQGIRGGKGLDPKTWSVHSQPWPKHDPRLIKEEKVTIIVQVNGKVRGQIKLLSNQAIKQSSAEKKAKQEPNVAKHLKGKKIKKTIFVPNRLINFVV